MLPSFLIQALFALGGVYFILCVTIFHYFRDRVHEHIHEKMSDYFSSSDIDEFLEEIREDILPSTLMKDFIDEISQITQPRRRFLSLLLCFPIAGGLFIFSASLASVTAIENEFITSIANTLELMADSTLLIAIVITVYCAFHLVKLARELA